MPDQTAVCTHTNTHTPEALRSALPGFISSIVLIQRYAYVYGVQCSCMLHCQNATSWPTCGNRMNMLQDKHDHASSIGPGLTSCGAVNKLCSWSTSLSASVAVQGEHDHASSVGPGLTSSHLGLDSTGLWTSSAAGPSQYQLRLLCRVNMIMPQALAQVPHPVTLDWTRLGYGQALQLVPLIISFGCCAG